MIQLVNETVANILAAYHLKENPPLLFITEGLKYLLS